MGSSSLLAESGMMAGSFRGASPGGSRLRPGALTRRPVGWATTGAAVGRGGGWWLPLDDAAPLLRAARGYVAFLMRGLGGSGIRGGL